MLTRSSLLLAFALAAAVFVARAPVYASAALRDGGALAPVKCQCEKGGKGCTCPKGQCECPNCAGKKR